MHVEAVQGRFRSVTWPFGSIYQAKVFVEYPASKGDTSIGIGLRPGKTRKEALERCHTWIEDYKKSGPPSVEQVLHDCYHHWPTIYRTRLDIIDHLFCTIGNGYSWLDGAVYATSPEAHLELSRRRHDPSGFKPLPLDGLPDDLKEKMIEVNFSFQALADMENGPPVGPIPETYAVHRFYPISESYSEICLVPDDVRPDWLAFTYEAACTVRDRSGISARDHAYERAVALNAYRAKHGVPLQPLPVFCPEPIAEEAIAEQGRNSLLASTICDDLEKRFPQLKS